MASACALCGAVGHFPKCSACKMASYCCREHQRRHRIQHKAACKAAMQAREAQAAAESASSLDCSLKSLPGRRHRHSEAPTSGISINELPRHLLARILAHLLPAARPGAVTSRFWPPRICDPDDSGPKDLARLLGHDTTPRPTFHDLHQVSMVHPSGAGARRFQSHNADAALGRFDPLRDANGGARAVLRLARVCKRWRSVIRDEGVIKHVALRGRELVLKGRIANAPHCGARQSAGVAADSKADAVVLPPNLQTLVLSHWSPARLVLGATGVRPDLPMHTCCRMFARNRSASTWSCSADDTIAVVSTFLRACDFR